MQGIKLLPFQWNPAFRKAVKNMNNYSQLKIGGKGKCFFGYAWVWTFVQFCQEIFVKKHEISEFGTLHQVFLYLNKTFNSTLILCFVTKCFIKTTILVICNQFKIIFSYKNRPPSFTATKGNLDRAKTV